MRWRFLRIVGVALALIAAGLLTFTTVAADEKAEQAAKANAAAPKAAAQEAPAAPKAAPDKAPAAQPAWTVTCVSNARATAPDCKIEQRLFAKETGRNLSVAVIDVPGATRKPMLALQLPNGLALQSGVAISVDDAAPVPLVLQSCDVNGCYATLALTPALIDGMKKGKVMTVKAVLAGGQGLALQHVLTDFAAAFEAAK